MPNVGGELAGYRLSAVLGSGGMSVVYKAEHARLGSVVAIKVLASELADDEVFRTRFLRESRIVASLSHPNVIPIYDSGGAGDLLYIAMRYVSGADLRAVLREPERLSPEQALLLVGQAGRALDASHRAGLIHRDVKPANILIEHIEDEPDHVYLADFGLSKHALSRSGSIGELAGTVDYIAPEQIKGELISERTDLYSLACVLYQCLTGRVPFQKDLDAAVIWAHVEEQAARPSSINPSLPAGVDDVLLKALAKDPAERYATCREFVEAAHEALTPRPSGAPGEEPADPSTVLAGDHEAPQESRTDRESDTSPADGQSDTSPSERQHEVVNQPSVGWLEASPPRDQFAWVPGPGPIGVSSRPRRWSAVAGVAAAVLVVALVVWLVARGHSSPSSPSHAAATPHGSTMPAGSTMPHTSTTSQTTTTSRGATMPRSPILAAVTRLDKSSVGARGLLPPSTCTAVNPSLVRCTNPHFAVTAVTFQTYHSLRGLYATYVQRARMLAGGHFKANVQNCTEGKPTGEVSWNHEYQHPRTYSVAQMASGAVSENDAAGRVFCTFADGDFVILWTQNAGHLLAELSGNPHADAWVWWKHVHHELGLGGGAMPMQMQ